MCSKVDKLDDRVLLCVGDQLEQHTLITKSSVHMGYVDYIKEYEIILHVSIV